MNYLVIDEMSMLGSVWLFHIMLVRLWGGCSCLLVGDFGQLPPVMDLPLSSSVPRSAISDLGCTTYQLFAKAVVN